VRDLEKIILASLIRNPALLGKSELETKFFEGEKIRRLFAAIEKLAISSNGSSIDPMILHETSGIELKEILEIEEGVHKFSEENFSRYPWLLRQRFFAKAFFSETEKQRKSFIQEVPVDFDQIKKTWEAVEEQMNDENLSLGKESETALALLQRDIEKRNLLIDPILAKREILVISGTPKIGKSIATLNIALSLAMGKSWLGFNTQGPARTAIFQTELSDILLKDRLEKITATNPRGAESIILMKGVFYNFDSKTGLANIRRTLKKDKVDLAVFDPLIDFHSKDENKAGDMALILKDIRRLADEFNIAIILVHHFAKKIEGQEREGGYLARGSSVISASVDSSWQMQRLMKERFEFDDIEDYLKTVELSFESRNCAVPRPKILRLDDDLWLKESQVKRLAKITPEDIVEAIERRGGQAALSDIRKELNCSGDRLRKIVEEAEALNLLDSVEIPGARGKAKILILKGR
jgi:RecA-family ATPase